MVLPLHLVISLIKKKRYGLLQGLWETYDIVVHVSVPSTPLTLSVLSNANTIKYPALIRKQEKYRSKDSEP